MMWQINFTDEIQFSSRIINETLHLKNFKNLKI